MKHKFIEATQVGEPFNWGKFMVAQFEASDWQVMSAMAPDYKLLPTIGYSAAHPERGLFVFDLQTREGAYFYPHGSARHDLDKHCIWVCPMFEPFLEWLYVNWTGKLDDLPALVKLENAPRALSGYRRTGRTPC